MWLNDGGVDFIVMVGDIVVLGNGWVIEWVVVFNFEVFSFEVVYVFDYVYVGV